MILGRFISILLLVVLLPAHSRSEGISPSITDGRIKYVGEDGIQREVEVGKPCADLWISPDNSVFAFISIERSRPPSAGEVAPFILESRIYVAFKREGFRPVLVDPGPVIINSRSWGVFRLPSVAPDLMTVYFMVPATMTSWKLISVTGGSSKPVSDAGSYCVVWGGEHSGELLMLTRQEPSGARPAVTYQTELLERSGSRVTISADSATFGEDAAKWATEDGGTCVEPVGE